MGLAKVMVGVGRFNQDYLGMWAELITIDLGSGRD